MIRHILLPALLFIVVLVAVTTLARAQASTTLILRQGVNGYTGVSDTWITSFEPDRANGNHDRLEMRGAGQSSSLLRFDLSRLPANVQIERAVLQLGVISRSNDNPADIGIYRLRRPWDAVSATWMLAATANPWAQPGAADPALDRQEPPAAVTHMDTTPQDYEWDITSFVQAWHADPAANFGMLLTGLDGPKVAYVAHSSQSVILEKRPQLSIEYSYLPATPTATVTPSATTPPTSTPFLDTPSPTATPTLSPTATATASPTATSTITPSPTATPTPTPRGLATEQAIAASCGSEYEGDTSAWPARIDRYTSCRGNWPETGPEAIYRLSLTNTIDLVASLFPDPAADLDLFLLDGPGPDACLIGEDAALAFPALPPGDYYLVVDGYQGSAGTFRLDLFCDIHLDYRGYLPLFLR